jgi:REP element-mobilizing transposase RayT
MSRPLRIQYPDAWYHVMNRGRRHETIFTSSKGYLSFIELLKEATLMWNIRIAAYCLMPNHYHLLIQTPESNISRAMRHIDGVYTQRFNRFNGFEGPLFRGRFKSVLVDADAYLLQLTRYIHRNPVRANLSRTIESYPWSSHKGYLSSETKWGWLFKDVVFSMLTEKKNEQIHRYKEFMHAEDNETFIGLMNRKQWSPMIGSEKFIEKIKRNFFSEKGYIETPQAKELSPGFERINIEVCQLYKVDQVILFTSKRGEFNKPRNVAIYLARRLRRGTLEEIGKFFGIEKYSSVSSIVERIKNHLQVDKILAKEVEILIFLITKSQEQT